MLAAAALRLLEGTRGIRRLNNCTQRADSLPVLLPRLLHTTGGSGGDGSDEPAAQQQHQPQQEEQRQRHPAAPSQQQQPPQQQQQRQQFPAYLFNAGPSLLRSDIAAFFDGTGLREQDIWPEYSWGSCDVSRYWLTFGSKEGRERGMARNLAYLGTRRVLLHRAQPHEFVNATHNPVAAPSAGRFVLVTGLSPSCYNEDLTHYFRGYDLLPKAVTFMRDAEGGHSSGRPWHGGGGGGGRADAAVVRFASPLEARRAVRSLQQGYVSGSMVRLRVLE